jgi:hypothetical protein
MIAPIGNFALGLYNADTYVTKDCMWYERVGFSDDTKKWIKESKPPEFVVKDLRQVARNNDIYKEVCDEKE